MKERPYLKNATLLEFLIGLLCVTIYFFALAVLLKIPIQDLPRTLVNSFYSPQHNLVFVDDIGGVNANLTLLFLIVFTALGIRLFRKILNRPAPYPAVAFSMALVLILYAGIQTINYARYSAHQNNSLYRKTEEERKEVVFGDLYAFSKFCRKHISGRAHGKLITDVDLYSTTGVYIHNALAYNLFPLTIQYNPRQLQIAPYYTIPKNPPEEIDYLVIYQKESPTRFIPAGFRVLEYYDEGSLIAAREN